MGWFFLVTSVLQIIDRQQTFPSPSELSLLTPVSRAQTNARIGDYDSARSNIQVARSI